MAASVREYERLQREVFGIVDRFDVLNETARRMLVANGSPAEKLVLNRLGLSHTDVTRKPAPEAQPTSTPVRFGYVGRLHASKGVIELVTRRRAIPRECVSPRYPRPAVDDSAGVRAEFGRWQPAIRA